MNIRETLLEVHSSDQANKIADYVGGDPVRFADLMKELLGPVYRVTQRAAWPVSLCVERHPELASSYFAIFIELLERGDVHLAVRRNVMRLLQFADIPKRHQGRAFDVAYKLFADVSQPVAVRADAMTVAANLAAGNAELVNELRLVAESHPVAATPGFRARARRIFGANESKKGTIRDRH